MKSKHIILVGSSLVAVATVGVVSATTHPVPLVPTKTAQTVTTDPQPIITEKAAVNTTPVTTTETVSTPQPSGFPIRQSDYGEDPNNPGAFIVFNKVAVMTAAGITADDQPVVDTLIGKMMNWRYKVAGFDANLCYALPSIKMAVIADDYADNPVTQLKYCDMVVQSRFGSWTAALAQYKGSGGF